MIRNFHSLADKWRADPVAFCEDAFGDRLWSWQKTLLRSVFLERRKNITIRSCNGPGKTHVLSRCVYWYAMVNPGSLVITTATKQDQVREGLWREVNKGYSRLRMGLRAEFEVGVEGLRCSNGSRAVGLTSKPGDATRMQGLRSEPMLIIIDEAAGVPPSVFEAADAMLTGEAGQLIVSGNPTNPVGDFAKTFSLPSYHKFAISAFDTPNLKHFGITQADIENDTWRAKIGTNKLPMPWLVTPGWVADKWQKWGKSTSDARYMSRVLARFPSSSPDTLIPLWWVEAAESRHITSATPVDPVELGVDIARFGDDHTVIVWRVGSIAKVLERIKGHDTMWVAGRIMMHLRESGATRIKVDEIGVGGGVVDRLRELGAPVVGVNVAERAQDTEKFANARAEYFWGLRERFESGDIILEGNTGSLKDELSSIKFFLNSRGQIQIEPKEDYKKRTGQGSPDCADALMLAFSSAGKRFVLC